MTAENPYRAKPVSFPSAVDPTAFTQRKRFSVLAMSSIVVFLVLENDSPLQRVH